MADMFTKHRVYSLRQNTFTEKVNMEEDLIFHRDHVYWNIRATQGRELWGEMLCYLKAVWVVDIEMLEVLLQFQHPGDMTTC